MREIAELAARNMAMPDPIEQEIASRMSEEDLPDDLREKLAHRVADLCEIASKLANPKFTPADIAQQLLAQHRSQKSSWGVLEERGKG